MKVEATVLLGLVCAAVGLLLWLRALVARQRMYAARGTVLLVVGGATMLMPTPAGGIGGRCWRESDSLAVALRERAAVERSMKRNVTPLIRRCEVDLARIDGSPCAADGDDQQRVATERSHVLSVLDAARRRCCEHAKALAELNAAIGVMERERELTYVKEVDRSRALARIVLSDTGSTTDVVLAKKRAR